MSVEGPSIAMVVAGALAAATTGAHAAQETGPITLVTTATEAGVVVQVVGLSDGVTAARYTLDVASGVPGGNRSVQSGSARLQPDRRAVLLTTRLGGAAAKEWTAHLRVEPEGGATYEVVRSAGTPREN